MVSREPAKLKEVKDIFKGEFKESSGINSPHRIETDEGSFSRLNTVATVEDTYMNSDNTYGSLQVTDSTATVRVKAFEDTLDYLEGIEKGDLVKIIGKVRKDDDGRFILGEIIKKIENPEYAKLRKLELGEAEEETETKPKETEEKKGTIEKASEVEAPEEDGNSEDLVIEEEKIE